MPSICTSPSRAHPAMCGSVGRQRRVYSSALQTAELSPETALRRPGWPQDQGTIHRLDHVQRTLTREGVGG
jgi:hypothetical protein